MAKTTATYDDGDAASSVLAYTDADGAKAPAGVCAYVSGTTALPVDATNRLPVTLGLTDAELRASAVAVSLSSTTITGSVSVTGPLTDAQLRASAVPVSDGGGSLTVDGTVGVSGSVAVTGTFWQATQPVSGPLTDAELRATAVPVSLTSTTVTGTVAVTQSGSWAVTLGAGSAAVGTVTAVGAAAHDTPVSGNPVLMGGYASTSAPSPNVDAGDAVRLWVLPNGTLPVTLVNIGGDRIVGAGADSVPVSAGANGVTAAAYSDADDVSYRVGGAAVVGGNATYCVPFAILTNSAGNEIASATTTPGASDRGLVVRVAGTVAEPAPTTPTLSNVSASATSVTVLAANSNRLTATVYNDSTAALYLKFGSAASTTSFTLLMAAGSYAEFPRGLYGTAIITGIWASATGAARVTEYV